jgi:opacity protein-like surface antigen
MNTKSLVAAAVIATLIASPALAQRAQQKQRPSSSNSAYDVYVNGQYVGSDPDPNIRAQLQRRQPGGSW